MIRAILFNAALLPFPEFLQRLKLPTVLVVCMLTIASFSGAPDFVFHRTVKGWTSLRHSTERTIDFLEASASDCNQSKLLILCTARIDVFEFPFKILSYGTTYSSRTDIYYLGSLLTIGSFSFGFLGDLKAKLY